MEIVANCQLNVHTKEKKDTEGRTYGHYCVITKWFQTNTWMVLWEIAVYLHTLLILQVIKQNQQVYNNIQDDPEIATNLL